MVARIQNDWSPLPKREIQDETHCRGTPGEALEAGHFTSCGEKEAGMGPFSKNVQGRVHPCEHLGLGLLAYLQIIRPLISTCCLSHSSLSLCQLRSCASNGAP